MPWPFTEELEIQAQPLLFCGVTVGGDAIGEQALKIEGLLVQYQIAIVHSGVVQDIGDHGQQVFRGLPGRGQVVALTLGQRLFMNQVNHAEHAVQRSPKFVTHGSEKL